MKRPPRAHRDANHPAIVDALTRCGCTVVDLAAVGAGVPDILVGVGGHNFLLEIKDGTRAPSARKLRETQVEFIATWRGHTAVVTDVPQALAAVGITGANHA